MAYQTKVFEVRLDSDKSKLAFGVRVAVVDYLRKQVADRLARAEDCGVDKQTAVQRFSLSFAGAQRGYRLPRAIPGSLVNWAAFVEFNKGMAGFPAADPHTVGAFGLDHAQELPGDVVLLKMGGIMFTGVCAGGLPGDVVEARVSETPDGYIATIVSGRPDNDSGVRMPTPVEPEGVDA